MDRIDYMATQVLQGKFTVAEAATHLTKEFGRSERGLRLLLGRRVARLKASPRRHRKAPTGSKTAEGMVKTLTELSKERRELVDQQERIRLRRLVIEEDIEKNRARLLRNLGVDWE